MTTKKNAVSQGVAAVLGTPDPSKKSAPIKSKLPSHKTSRSKKDDVPSPSKITNQGDFVMPRGVTVAKRKPGEAAEGKIKATYYINENVLRDFKHLCVDLDISGSEAVEKAMADLVKKHHKKR